MTERWTAAAAQDYRWFRERDPKTVQRIDRLVEDIKRRAFVGIGPSRCAASSRDGGRGGSPPSIASYAGSSARGLRLSSRSRNVAITTEVDTRRGLFLGLVSLWTRTTAQRSFPGALNKSDEEQDFYAGLSMVDRQLGHATDVPHPGDSRPGHEGGYFNKGAESSTPYEPSGSVPDSVTVAKLIEQGQ